MVWKVGENPLRSQVHIRREKVIWPGAKIQKTGEGMPNYDNNKIRGSLYITVDVNFPRGTFSESDSEGRTTDCQTFITWQYEVGKARTVCCIIQLPRWLAI